MRFLEAALLSTPTKRSSGARGRPRAGRRCVAKARARTRGDGLPRADPRERAAERDGRETRTLDCRSQKRESALALLELADVIGAVSTSAVDPVPAPLEPVNLHVPARWRPVLVRQLGYPRCRAHRQGGGSLVEFGTSSRMRHICWQGTPSICDRARQDPPPRLRGQAHPTSQPNRAYPRPRPNHLRGIRRSEFQSSTETRRKALALLLYLVTRLDADGRSGTGHGGTVARPDPVRGSQQPAPDLCTLCAADIDPWYETAATADYVPLDSDMVYLDPELVQVDSIAFMRQAAEALKSTGSARTGPEHHSPLHRPLRA